jgi:YfiH family protein
MSIQQIDDFHVFKFESFSSSEITHGIVGREGGVSPDPWRSLNVGGLIGDDADRVAKNVRRTFEVLGRQVGTKHDVWQSHAADFHIAITPRGNLPPVQADILISQRPDVTLFMRFADCVPILMHDPVQRVIAIVHAGWKGVTLDAPGKAIRTLCDTFGSRSEDIIVGLGPSICAECYPVGIEVANAVEKVFHGATKTFLWKRAGVLYLDLPLACRKLLENEGVRKIEMCDICTAMNLDIWYSHRGENGRTGRFGALLALEG